MLCRGGDGCLFTLQQSSSNMMNRFLRRQENPAEEPESKTLDDPWRELRWGEKQMNLQYVQEYKPEKDDIRYLRVLLYGPVGSGKSSFINSVSNVIRGRMTIPALASAMTSDQSFTKRYETHKFIKGRGSTKTFYPLVFNDIMGLEDGTDRGVHADDIKLALKGHVKEGHKFNPVAPISQNDPGYNPTPSADDKVHVLVCVMSANTPQMNSSVLEKMKSIREAASDLGIPQMAMMTHIDEACGEIEKELKNVYKSKYLKKKMKDFSSAVGIPMNCIFPVKNYSEEINLNDDIDALILSALRKMVDFGDDFIEKI
ncbi:PREDICTED: interferon-induced protein 44-like isoform X2 [Poecilia mexicana]|uniref:G domain-containing protein n=1 Tax=Poecilia mexicana TaxID=48701 RepID=A0A3B3XRB5_9TELE|nr:PREDICTED: interferon-induced protein 44-like isoform X2 [Poecilia mexicana]